MENLKNSIKENVELIKDKTGHSADVIYKYIEIGKNKLVLIFAESMVNSKVINDFILDYINNNKFDDKKNIIDVLYQNIPISKSNIINSVEDLLYNLYAGFVLVINNGDCRVLALESRTRLESAIATAESESVVKGPKDAFTENYNDNIGMIRRRIKSEELRLEEIKVGKKGKTKVGVMYVNDIVDKELVDDIISKIKKIDIDVLLGSNYVIKLITPNETNPFTNYLSTERPDRVVSYLLNGRIAIVLENAQLVSIVPIFFADFFQSSEDYYERSINTNVTRIVRFMSFLITLLAPAIYIAVSNYNQESIPTNLLINLAMQRDGVPFPSVMELFLLLGTFEIIKESNIRMPSAMGNSLSIVGSLVLGQAAVQAGVFSPMAVIVVSITVISGLIVNSLDIINGLRFWRLVLLFLSTMFGALGVLMGIITMTINMTSLKSFGKPYLFPIAPFYPEDQNAGLFLSDKKRFESRTSITAKKNKTRGKM